MDNEYIEVINSILEQKAIDKRLKQLVKLYFIGKVKASKITIKELNNQIDTLCFQISNAEFTSGNIVVAYSKQNKILTINKQLLKEGRAEEVILPVFMKFESALNSDNRRKFANHIEDFIKAGQIAKACSAPISDRLHKLYEMARYSYGDIEHKADKLSEDGVWRGVCSKYNDGLNNAITTGLDDPKKILSGANIFHGEVFTIENIENPEFVGPFNNEEYQEKAARIISLIDSIRTKDVMELIDRIKLYTGCTDEKVKKAHEPLVGINAYTGDKRITDILQSTMKNDKTEINEEIIASKVQELLDRKPNWDSRIKHLVIPFFIRSQRIYGWDLDEFQERLNQLGSKIEEIIFIEFEDTNTTGRTARDKIELNSRIFFNKKGEPSYPVSPTLFHELGHITDENEREGVYTKERLESLPLIEIRFYEWTNTIFERLVSGANLYKKNDGMELSSAGYDALAPFGSMLSCALGIPEIEFANIKDRGREYEKKLIDSIFPNSEGKEDLSRIRKIFDEYELDTFFSLGKKKANQNLINEMYTRCINLMKKRIQIEHNSQSKQENDEQYKKRQMYLLRKMNYNLKKASRTEGFRFSMSSLVHDIGYCNDKITKSEVLEVAKEFVEKADFGFDNNDLGKYSRAVAQSTRKQLFNQSLQMTEHRNEKVTTINNALEAKQPSKEKDVDK